MTDDVLSRRRLLAGMGSALAGSAAGCTLPSGSGRQEPVEDETPESPTAEYAGTDRPPAPDDAGRFTRVYRQTVDSVVMIRAFTSGRSGQGSGFVFKSPRYIVTNQHVVENATNLEIRYSRDDWETAEVVGTDYYSDLAVLEVDDPPAYAEPLPLVREDPPIGSHIAAIGTPFGFEKTISAGIVSGVDRSMDVNFNRPGGFSIPDAVQTDAALNPGNSGGPLLSMDGEVVAVVRAGQGDNVGFGISAALTRRVATALIEDGSYDHSYMGVSLTSVSPTIADANDLEEIRGVIVTSVLEDGPSEGVLEGSETERQDGVQVPVGGDVIVRLDDEGVETLADLSTYLALETAPGDTIDVTVVRDGSREPVALTLGTRPPPSA